MAKGNAPPDLDANIVLLRKLWKTLTVIEKQALVVAEQVLGHDVFVRETEQYFQEATEAHGAFKALKGKRLRSDAEKEAYCRALGDAGAKLHTITIAMAEAVFMTMNPGDKLYREMEGIVTDLGALANVDAPSRTAAERNILLRGRKPLYKQHKV
jgi:hypothetical protein